VARGETVGERLHRLREERGLSQRELASPGVSYAYISRIEAGQRTPSVKALRQLASGLGVSVEFLETGTASPVERGVLDAGLDFASLSRAEARAIRVAADAAAREAARVAAEEVLAKRRASEAAILRERLRELERQDAA
jgi:transcriptional regulator with XRE-family HTH domain